MRVLLRTLIILLAAGAVIGVTLLMVDTSATGAGGFRQRPAVEGTQGQTVGQDGGGEFVRGERGRHAEGGGMFAFGEILKSLAIIAVVTAIIAPLTRWLQQRQRRRRRSLESADPA